MILFSQLTSRNKIDYLKYITQFRVDPTSNLKIRGTVLKGVGRQVCREKRARLVCSVINFTSRKSRVNVIVERRRYRTVNPLLVEHLNFLTVVTDVRARPSFNLPVTREACVVVPRGERSACVVTQFETGACGQVEPCETNKGGQYTGDIATVRSMLAVYRVPFNGLSARIRADVGDTRPSKLEDLYDTTEWWYVIKLI